MKREPGERNLKRKRICQTSEHRLGLETTKKAIEAQKQQGKVVVAAKWSEIIPGG